MSSLLSGLYAKIMVKELSSTQIELFESCRRGDAIRVQNWICNKKSKRPRTPLNFLRPSTPSVGWLAAIKDPSSFYTALHNAALGGHEYICKILIDADVQLAASRDKRGCVPIHLAAFNGHHAVVKLLVDACHETVDAVNNASESALHLSAQHGHARVVRILLEKRASPFLRNARSESPLDIAARTGHAIVCKTLIGFYPNLALQSAVECSSTAESGHVKPPVVYPLHAAARHSHIACLQILRLAGFDIDYVTEEGSALHVAAMFGQIESVNFLISEGINPFIRDSQGRTVLEMLEEHELQKASDLTQIIQSRDGWEECRLLIEEYIRQRDFDVLNSSSDSGIDRRDSDKHYKDSNDSDAIWKRLPAATGFTNGDANKPYKHPPSIIAARVDTKREDSEAPASLAATSFRDSEVTLPTFFSSTLPSRNMNRTWASNMYDPENGTCRFPMTSPFNQIKHYSSNRTNTLPINTAPLRTKTTPPRASILPPKEEDPCSYKSPPQYDAWQNYRIKKDDGTSYTYNPNCMYDNVPKNALAYDNAPPTGHRRWDHACTGSIGRSTKPFNSSHDYHGNGMHTLPAGRRTTRPPLGNFSPIIENSPNEKLTQGREGRNDSLGTIREREDSLGLSHSPRLTTRDNSRQSSVTFACSTLERSASPGSGRSNTPTGRAPLALPEELTGSTSTSIISTSISPERSIDIGQMFSSATTGGDTSSTMMNSEIMNSDRDNQYRRERPTMDTPEHSFSSLSVEAYEPGPPSPNTSQRDIFNILLNNSDLSDKLSSAAYLKKSAPMSPAATECSDSTVASSCSLPMISQISNTPPSINSPRREFPTQYSTESINQAMEVKMRPPAYQRKLRRSSESMKSLNEVDEWNKIDEIMSSFGGKMCRESVFASEVAPRVAVYLRDRHSQALTIQLKPNPLHVPPPVVDRNNTPPRDVESKFVSISQWLNTTIGIPNPKANEIGTVLIRNGYDKIHQLQGCLTPQIMHSLGIDKSIQHQITSYLDSVDEMRTTANEYNYVSDWLCSLELTDYLGNFVTAGLKSMLIVRAAELTADNLKKMGIVSPGHIARLLHSLKRARQEEIEQKMQRAADMKRALSPSTSSKATGSTEKYTNSNSYSPKSNSEDEPDGPDLVNSCCSFSAHYLGSTEISNIDGTDESRMAMTRLKKNIREIAKIPQVILEISVHGVKVFDANTRVLSVDHVITQIQIVCQDERDLNCFTYISHEKERNFCHVFCVLTADVASEIIMTLGKAFEMAFAKQREDEPEEIDDV